jgi:hypothetical protein
MRAEVTGACAAWHASCISGAMSIELNGIPAAVLMKRSGVSFFTRRVLQRWLRGELTTDAALALIATQDAERIITAWTEFRA